MALTEGGAKKVLICDDSMLIRKQFQTDSEAVVIMLSSVGTKENLREALELGATDFIQKPWKEEQLVNAISRIANNYRKFLALWSPDIRDVY